MNVVSRYTTEVRFICETYAGETESQEVGKVNDVLDKSWDKVFDFDFPIFDEAYRKILCVKILRHYYTREIGLETVGLWKLKLETKMNEIMPYYNKLYESETLKYNPLYDADYTKSHSGNDAGESNESGDRNGSGRNSGNREGNIDDNGGHSNSTTRWDVYSDTPQGALTNVNNETYLTDARKITESDSGTQYNARDYNEENVEDRTYEETNEISRNFSNTNEFVEHVMGKMPGSSYSKMIKEYRGILLNIDMLIIEQLSDLFFKLWR